MTVCVEKPQFIQVKYWGPLPGEEQSAVKVHAHLCLEVIRASSYLILKDIFIIYLTVPGFTCSRWDLVP